MSEKVYIVTAANALPDGVTFRVFCVFDNGEAAMEYREELVKDGKQNVAILVKDVRHTYIAPAEEN